MVDSLLKGLHGDPEQCSQPKVSPKNGSIVARQSCLCLINITHLQMHEMYL